MQNRALSLAGLLASALLVAACASTKAPPAAPPADAIVRHGGVNLVNETPEEFDARMEWFRDAKFGMFIHWGLYSVAAGEWNGKPVRGIGEWLLSNAEIKPEDYESLQQRFNPVKFDAKRWVAIAKNAGMKYIVITSKHHDGFGLWDSPLSEWDVGGSPFAPRDPLKELADACAEAGIRLCFYHSIMDWHHPDYLPRRAWDTRPTDGADYARYEAYMKAQLKELVSGRYGKIGILWFDGEWEGTWTHEKGKALYDYVRGLDPDIIVNNRVDTGRSGMEGITREGDYRGDYGTPEQQIPATGLGAGVDWETCMTMNDTWGFKKRDENWKSSADLIRKLVDIASKGGNFLLNVGPTGEGEIPAASVERLETMGAWMKTNSRAVQGTQANPFPEPPSWGRITRAKNEDGSDRLYLHVFDWPSDGTLELSGLLSEPRAVQILGQRTRNLWPTTRSGDTLVMYLPKEPLDAVCTVVALDLADPLEVARLPVIEASDDKFVGSMMATVAQPAGRVVYRFTTDGSDPVATSATAGAPIALHATSSVKARGFLGEKPVTTIVARSFEALDPKPAVQPFKLDDGLAYRAYTVGKGIKSCAAITDGALAAEGVAAEPSVAVKPREEEFGLVFTGFIEVPETGLYRFFVDSDDGSIMKLHGAVVVDNDGPHSATEKSGAIALEKGLHPVEILMFEDAGQDLLRVSWRGPGMDAKAIVPTSAWKR
ncbi:MAG: alpha-L-fucosidase [Planctomycetota bacterium]|nr:alpha-L-fucosidase [Planctomycetota bacterium]